MSVNLVTSDPHTCKRDKEKKEEDLKDSFILGTNIPFLSQCYV